MCTVRRDSEIRLACALALALSACVRQRAPSRDNLEPSAGDRGKPVQQPGEPHEPPLVADFPVPTLSPESRAAWNVFAEGVCRRMAEQPPPAPDCTPPGHTTPCRTRSFAADLRRCDGSSSCLKLALQAHECRRCDTKISDEIVRTRIEEVSEDCAGLLRFADAPRSHDKDDLLDLAQTPRAIECLAKSKHPRARYVLARWRRDQTAAKILTGDPKATRAWLRHELSRIRKGRVAAFDGWTFWDAFDLLGAEADPLLPEVRALAVHPFPGDWQRDQYVYEAIGRLGARRDRDAIPVLRRILADATDWRAQEVAAKSLGEIGVDAVEAAPALDDAARDHWATNVRAMATWAAARVRGEGSATPPAPATGVPPHDERCPIGFVSMNADDEHLRGGVWRQRWPWIVTIGDRRSRLPDPNRPAPVMPRDLPQLDLAARFPEVEGAGRSLAESATAILPLDRGWVVGTNIGEFGGSLWWIDQRGRARHLVGANVRDIVQLGGDLYAVQGLAHMGSDQGSLIRIEDTPRGVQVHHALELPSYPEVWWMRGEELWVGTLKGFFVVDADMHVRTLPCHADDTYPATLDAERIAPVIARARPIVDRCLEALPPADLPCGGSFEPSVALQFRVDASGSVTAAEPLGESWHVSFPEVEACIAAHATDWRFPAPMGGAAIFGYAFSRPATQPVVGDAVERRSSSTSD